MKSPLQHALDIATIYDRERENLHQSEFTPPRVTRIFAELTEARDIEVLDKVEELARAYFPAAYFSNIGDLMRECRLFISRTRKPCTSARELLELMQKRDAVYEGKFAGRTDRSSIALSQRIADLEAANAQQASQLNQWNAIGELISKEPDIASSASIPGIALSWVQLWNNHRKTPPAPAPWVKQSLAKLSDELDRARKERADAGVCAAMELNQHLITKDRLEKCEKVNKELQDSVTRLQKELVIEQNKNSQPFGPEKKYFLEYIDPEGNHCGRIVEATCVDHAQDIFSKEGVAYKHILQVRLYHVRGLLKERSNELLGLRKRLKSQTEEPFKPETFVYRVEYKTNPLAVSRFQKSIDATSIDHALDIFRKTHPDFWVVSVVL